MAGRASTTTKSSRSLRLNIVNLGREGSLLRTAKPRRPFPTDAQRRSPERGINLPFVASIVSPIDTYTRANRTTRQRRKPTEGRVEFDDVHIRGLTQADAALYRDIRLEGLRE